MSKSEPILKKSIHLAMAAILSDISAIPKLRKNEAQGFKFRGIDDCYCALHPIFAAHGVVCLPTVESVTHADVGKNAKGNTLWRTTVMVIYQFTASDGSQVESKICGEGFDYADKGTAKSLSAAHKYLLLQTFLIPVEDIADADAYDPTVDPREELSKLRDQEAMEAVNRAVETGESPELPDAARKALDERRQAAQEALDREGLPGTPVKHIEPPEQKKAKVETAKKPAPAEKPEANPTAAATDWRQWTLEQVKTPEYHGRKLGDLHPEDLQKIKEMWVDRYAEKIAKDPARKKEAEVILFALAELAK